MVHSRSDIGNAVEKRPPPCRDSDMPFTLYSLGPGVCFERYMTQSTSDFGLASDIFVVPEPPLALTMGRYALGPGESLARKITQSISDFGLALENRPPPGRRYFPVAGSLGRTFRLGGFVSRSSTSAGNGRTLFFRTQCPGPKREGGTHTAPSPPPGGSSERALP